MSLDSIVQRLPSGVIVGFLIGAFTVLVCWAVLAPRSLDVADLTFESGYNPVGNAVKPVVWKLGEAKCIDPAPQVAYAYCKGMLDVATRERIPVVCDVDGVRYNNTGLVNGSWFVVNYSRGFVYE